MANFEGVSNGINLIEEANSRWGVDLTNDRAVLSKMVSFQGRMPDVADLSNMWRDYQKLDKSANLNRKNSRIDVPAEKSSNVNKEEAVLN